VAEISEGEYQSYYDDDPRELENPDTPAERTEGNWNEGQEPEDVGFPEREYSDEDIDEMLLEENAIVRRMFIERAKSYIRWVERSGIEQVQ
jgi:hypothetical protein